MYNLLRIDIKIFVILNIKIINKEIIFTEFNK